MHLDSFVSKSLGGSPSLWSSGILGSYWLRRCPALSVLEAYTKTPRHHTTFALRQSYKPESADFASFQDIVVYLKLLPRERKENKTEFRKEFLGTGKFLGQIFRNFQEISRTFPGRFQEISRNFLGHFLDFFLDISWTFLGTFGKFPGN